MLFGVAERMMGLDVMPDGERFLVHLAPVDTPPIHVIRNALPDRDAKGTPR